VTFAIDKLAKSAAIPTITQPANVNIVSPRTADVPTLSTSDSGPDASQCVGTGNAVPWFYNACCSTCATYLGGYWTVAPVEPHPMVSYIDTEADLFGNVVTDVCGGATPKPSEDASPSFIGIDTMEMYLR
jgi:hypothetical protein